MMGIFFDLMGLQDPCDQENAKYQCRKKGQGYHKSSPYRVAGFYQVVPIYQVSPNVCAKQSDLWRWKAQQMKSRACLTQYSPRRRILIRSKTLHSTTNVAIALTRGSIDQHFAILILRCDWLEVSLLPWILALASVVVLVLVWDWGITCDCSSFLIKYW